MILFLHGGDLDPIVLYGSCLVGIGLFGAITCGLVYLAGRLAEKHGEMWENRLNKEKLEAEPIKETND